MSATFTVYMITSSNGNIFRVTGPLCGDFTGHRWIPLTKASDAELWCFLWSAPIRWLHGRLLVFIMEIPTPGKTGFRQSGTKEYNYCILLEHKDGISGTNLPRRIIWYFVPGPLHLYSHILILLSEIFVYYNWKYFKFNGPKWNYTPQFMWT